METHHGIQISDQALVTAAVYSDRYVPDRYLPDKAIDLVDEASSALKLAQESRPDILEKLDRDVVTLEIERESLKNEDDIFSASRRTKVVSELEEKKSVKGEGEGSGNQGNQRGKLAGTVDNRTPGDR
jgi:ATP-dependent Clp protease ATP-binding subunit ClpB